MVSSIHTIRQWSSQAALNAFKEASEPRSAGAASSGSSGTSLADILYSGNDSDDDDYEDTKLTALIASLQQTLNRVDPTVKDEDGAVGDMSSKAFMKALRDKLEGLKANPDTAAMADKMLKALDAGTLTVTDAVAGEQVKAFDVTDSKQLSAAKTEVDKSDWTSFLKDLLVRDGNGKFIRNADSSYIEKATGANSYFGMVGEAYYYLSWTTPPVTSPAATTTATPDKGTASGSGTASK